MADESIFDLTVDAKNVYWTSYGYVSKLPVAGGAPAVVAGGSEPTGMAVDATYLYWDDAYGAGALMKLPLAGGSATTLASAPADRIAIDANAVYWTDSYGGVVMKVASNGGTPVILAFGQKDPITIAVDAVSVYWSTGDGLMKTPK